MSSANEIRDLNRIYLEAVYGGGKKEEGKKATPESGTGKYYKEGKPTDQQLAQRKKREKIKQLTNQGKHKEASALHNEDAKYGYDKDGNSLNPVDIEKRKKKEDDLAGSPNLRKEGRMDYGVDKMGNSLDPEDHARERAQDVPPAEYGTTNAQIRAARDPEGKYAEEQVRHLRALVEKVVKVKDTKKVVDAIRAYDKSKDASRDATYDTDKGEKEKGDIEKKYAAKERGEIDKDDPNWKKRKYHTGIHGEEVESLKRLVESGKFSDEEIEAMAWDVYEGYQRNPEKGEEEERKAEKRRKESGRMPPRGDKRREDFEKWYAANVR